MNRDEKTGVEWQLDSPLSPLVPETVETSPAFELGYLAFRHALIAHGVFGLGGDGARRDREREGRA